MSPLRNNSGKSSSQLKSSHSIKPKNSHVPHSCSLEMPKDELPNHNCIKHLRSVVQQQQTKISELEKTVAEHKHQLGEQVRMSMLTVVCKTGFEQLIRIFIFLIATTLCSESFLRLPVTFMGFGM